MKNSFYIAKKDHDQATIFAGFSWASGEWKETGDDTIAGMAEIDVVNADFIKSDTSWVGAESAIYYWLDSNKKIIARVPGIPKFNLQVPARASYFSMDVKFSKTVSRWSDFYVYLYNSVVPHYKTLSKQYKKEDGNVFFRESLSGKITLFGKDYELINSASALDTLVFDIYRGETLFITTEFNKTDCKFNKFRKSVELKLTPHDKYTKILEGYKNTYDIIKCAPATTWLTMVKRCIVQIYIQGENVISNYSGGTYWEFDVDESIDSESALKNKYFFHPGPTFGEINLTGFNYDINASYICSKGSIYWNANSYIEENGVYVKKPCSIKFAKRYSAGEIVSSGGADIKLFSDGISDGATPHGSPGSGGYYTADYDTYQIEIYMGVDGTGQKIYQSTYLYGADKGFIIKQGDKLYKMEAVELPEGSIAPSPSIFYLGAMAIEYKTWVRLLCDLEVLEDGTETHNLPYDDFASERTNYKRCVGLTGTDTENSVIKIVQKEASSDEPTAYGQNDYGQYFISPYTGASSFKHGYLPLCRSIWGNSSLWVYLDNSQVETFENWCSKVYKKYTLKDAYHISAVIKALLNKIDSSIKHEGTAEYSEFLYGDTNIVSKFALNDSQLYITQKTNILKGEYDQAAQKAEISLQNVMEMLQKCFNCYWYIDKDNKFRIEHLYYFTHGYSYADENAIKVDFTKERDKFNRCPILYDQQELQYEKSGLKARYEFEWSDDTTDAMGNISINFNDAYIPKNNTETITPDLFCPDIDYMVFKPDDFSNDGFALIAAKNKEVQILPQTIYDPKQFGAPLDLYTLNATLSWRQLIYHRMYGTPGEKLVLDEYEGPAPWSVKEIQHFIKHDIEVIPKEDTVDIRALIITDVGQGYVDTADVDIDTNKMKISLLYAPD